MKILNTYPPNIKEIREHFDVPDNAIFTYGDTIYNPNDVAISKSLMKHEATHTKQQGDDIEGWWKRYFDDTDFRLSQELEAYQVQYRSAKGRIKNREELNKYLHSMAMDLSGKMYGSMIPFFEAYKLIKKL